METLKLYSRVQFACSNFGHLLLSLMMTLCLPCLGSLGDDDLDIDTLFAPDDVEVTFAKPKTNVFGMGYSGLDRTSVLSVKQNDPSRTQPDTFRLMDNNKKLAIRGQVWI